MTPTTKIFELRLIPEELHRAIKELAFRQKISMNTWLLKAIEQAATEQDKD